MAKSTYNKKVSRIAIGSDHAGFAAKTAVVKMLKAAGYKIHDVGTTNEESTDYPDYAFAVGKAVTSGKADRGILACGTGIGMCIAANKVVGVRAAVAWSVESAELAAEHNRANVLCISGRLIPLPLAKKIVKTWLTTPADLSERHERRIGKISKFELK